MKRMLLVFGLLLVVGSLNSSCTQKGDAASVTSEKKLGNVVAYERTIAIDFEACEKAWSTERGGCYLGFRDTIPSGQLFDSKNYRSYESPDGKYRISVKVEGSNYWIRVQNSSGDEPLPQLKPEERAVIIAKTLKANPEMATLTYVAFEIEK